MKTVRLLIIIILVITGTFSGYAQEGGSPPPPPPENFGGNGNNVPGGGAPIGSGLVLLITLALGYGGKKVYHFRKNKPAEGERNA